MKVKLVQVKLVEELYPRRGLDMVHVSHLQEAIRAGETLPPIVVNEDMVLLDGAHRREALLREFGPDAEHEVQVVQARGVEALAYAARINARHGLRLSAADQALVAARLLEAGLPEIEVASVLGISVVRLQNLQLRVRRSGERLEVVKRPLVGKGASSELNARVNGADYPVRIAKLLTMYLREGIYPWDEDSRRALEELWKEISLCLYPTPSSATGSAMEVVP